MPFLQKLYRNYVSAKCRNDRNDLSLHLAFVRREVKKAWTDRQKFHKIPLGVPFCRNEKEYLEDSCDWGGSRKTEWKRECTT